MSTRTLAGPTAVIDPSILYLGTPVALIGTRSRGGTVNLAPISSTLFLGKAGVLGCGTRSQTAQNLTDTRECTIGLASADLAPHVDALALTTGRSPVPEGKAEVGYEHVADKFGRAGLTAVPADLVSPPRVVECPISLEARVTAIHPLAEDDPQEAGGAVAVEVHVLRAHVHEAVRMAGTAHRIDPVRWRPLLQSFQRYFSTGPEVRSSRLSTVDEEWYR